MESTTVPQINKYDFVMNQKLRPSSNNYGTLFFGKLKNDTSVVFKKARSQMDREAVAQLMNEGRIFAHIQDSSISETDTSPHITRLLAYSSSTPKYFSQPEVILALEPFAGDLGDLYKNYVKKHKIPSMVERLDICLQIAKGMRQLASLGVIHKDLKKENILFEKNAAHPSGYRFAITDFGCSILLPTDFEPTKGVDSSLCGNLGGRAPENLVQIPKGTSRKHRTSTYSVYSDVYSFAVCIWEILTLQDVEQENWGTWGCSPYDEFETAVVKGGRPSLEHLQGKPELQELLKDCWSFDRTASPAWNQKQRPSWDEIVERLEVTLEGAITKNGTHA